MSQVFLTGASGYLGGQVLHELCRSQPDLSISVLVRDSAKAEVIRQALPNVRVVLGDLDDEEVLEREAERASIVLHLATFSHLKSTQAIQKGLKRREPSTPAYWIHISGASIFSLGELDSTTFTPGDPSSTVFDDLSEVSAIQKLIRAHPSRAVDNYILDVAAEKSHIRTALVIPPIIYGVGEGPVNQRSMQIPGVTNATLEKGHGVQVGKGLSIWGNVHIHDLGRLFSALVQAAAKRDDRDGLWGENGIYLTGVGEMTFGEISSKVAHAAKGSGLIKDDKIEELDSAAADAVLERGTVLFGTNARSNARRAKELLQWKALEDSIDADILRSVTEAGARQKHTNVGS